jgi:hypothetical protein
MEGVLARPLAWTVSEDADGAADLEGVFGAGVLLVEASGRRVGIVGSGGSGFLAEDILMPADLPSPDQRRVLGRCKACVRQWLEVTRRNVIYMPIAELKKACELSRRHMNRKGYRLSRSIVRE